MADVANPRRTRIDDHKAVSRAPESEQSLREVMAEEEPWPVDPNQPTEDVLEQRREIDPEAPASVEPELPLEADPGDAMEQQLEVDVPDDEQGAIRDG